MPSGDHSGLCRSEARSPAGVGTSVWTAPPATSAARMPPELGAEETNASIVPSGDQAGAVARVPDARGARSEPSGFTVYSRAGVSLVARTKAIFEPSGDHAAPLS